MCSNDRLFRTLLDLLLVISNVAGSSLGRTRTAGTSNFAVADVATALYPHGPMFGGRSIGIEEVPYLVTVFFHSNGNNERPLCSGLLISRYHVLTTAHCIVDHDWSRLKVHVNSSFHNVEVQTEYSVERMKVHESFSVSKHGVPMHDLALLKVTLPEPPNNDLSEPTANVVLDTAKLFNDSEDIGAGVDALTTGWTKIDGSSEQHLTARIVPTLDTSLCDKAYESVGGVPAGQICAAYPGANGMDGCQGDRGSPLIIEGRVAGILSWGNGCIKPRYPGLYTKIAYYMDWIDETMERLL